MASNKPHKKEFMFALMFSSIFTIALFYLTLEAPVVLDKILHQYFPEVFYDVEAIDRVLSVLRPIGYSALAITLILIFIGFLIKKGFLTFLGSLVLYIPTFGYFAYAMFFLTGLGVLRALWLPILELSPSILKLGCVVYLLLSIVPHVSLIGLIITFIGLFIFLLGTITWLYGKFKGCEFIDFWIYKYSRHPQYLGFILWSYGLLVFISYKPYIRGAFVTPPALIWLISIMLVIGIALSEELEMKKRYGEKYEEYLKKTPFMIPLPRVLTKIMMLPRFVDGYFKNMKEVVVVMIIYTAIFVTISYVLMLMSLC